MKTIATTKIDKVENNNNLRLWRSIEHAIMKRHVLLNRVLAVGLLAVITVPVGQAAQAQGKQDLLRSGRVSSGWVNRQLDSEHGRCVSRCSRSG